MRKGSSVAAGLKKDSLWQSICKHKGLYLMALPGFIWFLLFKYVPLAGAVIAFRLFRPYPAQGKKLCLCGRRNERHCGALPALGLWRN